MIRTFAATVACSAVYGFALGSAHSELYALRNLAKFPLLLIATALICAVAYWFVGRTLLPQLSFKDVQRATWRLFHDLAVLLASLAPVVLFFAWTSRARDDGQLGDYDNFLAFNVVLVAVAGVLALVRQVLELSSRHAVPGGRARSVAAAWLVLSLVVGGQVAFVMRPFFGFPATRGNTPPFFLGNEPDRRGATNFYEAVWQTISEPDLPTTWRYEQGK